MKSNARSFETLGSLLKMLNTMTAYNLPPTISKRKRHYVKGLTAEKQLEMAKNILILQGCIMWLSVMQKHSLRILKKLD